MAKFDAILQNEQRLRSMTGMDKALFLTFLPHFTAAMENYLAHTTLDGYIRESDRALTYANSPLPTATDRLLFILTYLKLNPIQEVQGQLFGMSQPNVSKWSRLLMEIMLLALDRQGMLPARTASELATYLQTLPAPTDPETPPLFVTMAQNDQ